MARQATPLKRQAYRLARIKGHRLRDYWKAGPSRMSWTTECEDCGLVARLNPVPMRNQGVFEGEPFRLFCKDSILTRRDDPFREFEEE